MLIGRIVGRSEKRKSVRKHLRSMTLVEVDPLLITTVGGHSQEN